MSKGATINPINDHFGMIIRKVARFINQNDYRLDVTNFPGDGPDYDAFGRKRVSNLENIFDHKQISGLCPCILESIDSGGTESFTFLKPQACTRLQVGNANDEYAILQTRRYFPYMSGKSQLIMMTGNLKGAESGVIKRIGYFDDDNGIFFELNEHDFRLCIRTKASGSVVNNYIERDDFNGDKLDGSGNSGHTIDFSKSHIFVINFQWLGVGNVSFGLSGINNSSGGNSGFVELHKEQHANKFDSVYMSTPTLPLRYEIRKNDTTTGPHYLDSVCMSVSTEGGAFPSGREFGVGHLNGNERTVSSSLIPIMAIRLKSEYPSGYENRIGVMLKYFDFFCENKKAIFQIKHVNDPTFGGGTSWISVDSQSAVEYSLDVDTVTSSVTKILDQRYVPAGNKGASTDTGNESIRISNNRFIAQNYASNKSQAFVVYAQNLDSGSATCYSTINWTEFD